MSAPAGPAGVAVVLVTHDGAAWLPTVVAGLAAQTVRPDRVVVVDTGSKDASPEIVVDALGPQLPVTVRRLAASAGFPDAVAAGLDELDVLDADHGAARPASWVWVLHDDAHPAPDALERLLATAAERPEAALLGPKLRAWPSLRALLELGVTISGTGRRETGLERGEYDQGQHDRVREVLAVNSAGLLARREVLVGLGGYDADLPIFGNDLDLGWRAAAAGHTTLIVPSAVVFHAEAAHRGLRRTPLTGRHPHFQERRAALFTLLANARGAWLPLLVLRALGGSLLRALGLLVVRAVGEALDEVAAVVDVLRHPGRVRAARRRRAAALARAGAEVDRARVRRLLAPWWLPLRHGLDLLGDVAAAATQQAADVAERRREAAALRDPAAAAPARHRDEDDDFADSGWVVRFFTSPVAIVCALVVIALLVGVRDVVGGIHGGALSPAPDGVGAWWRLHLEGHHDLGFGSQVPAPAYVLPLAVIGSVLSPGLTVSALLALAAPFALWGAWRFLRVVGRLATPEGAPRWLLLWGSITWAVLPLASGAWGGGRWGVVLGAALLPWLAHAALGFVDPDAERRWRAAWRTGLLLALTVAVVPSAWLVVAAVVATLLALARRLAPAAVGERSVWAPPLVALAVPLAALLPWWLPALLEGAWPATVLDVGRWPTPALSGWDLLAARLPDLGAPLVAGLALPLLAAAALVPASTRIAVLVCWVVAAVTALVAVPLALPTIDLPGRLEQQPGLGAVLLVLHASWLVAAFLGGLSLHHLGDRPRPAQGAMAVAALAGVAATAVGVAWFAVRGGEELTDDPASDVPVYMAQRAERAPEDGVLVLRGDIDSGLTYDVRRGQGRTLGEDEVLALTPEDREVTALVRTLVTSPDPDSAERLARLGVLYVVQPAPADGTVAARLDATTGLEQASAERGTRAWQVTPAPGPLPEQTSWLRWLLLLAQLAAVPTLVVLALPTLRRNRDE
ncbi:glycosyltransferase [Nocardioides sp.]|uniref:glycosyltransferase n=1 Tax=Nocardioides sp. TaxID=35761 RepID=UPI00351466EE